MEIFNVLNFDLIPLTLRLAVPITLAAIGGTLSERSGIINIGLEGMMLMGAFGAVYGSFLTGSPGFGVIFACLAGLIIGSIHAVLTIKYKANQVVTGVGINILAMGFTTTMIKVIWGKKGMSGEVNNLSNISIPILKDIPLIDWLFTDQSPLTYFMLIVVILSWYILFKTNIGLNLRAIGDHPRAARISGINVTKYRYVCVILSGLLAGLGGAFLSLVQNSLFVQNMTAGRGYMALAANIFGGWNPLGSFVASLIFSFAQAIRFNMIGYNIPDQFIQSLPYILTLAVSVSAGIKTRAPEALGEIDE